MTKKQLKQLAKRIADLEYTIQHSSDKNEVDNAKKEMMQATDSAELDIDDMLRMEEYIQAYMDEKNI